MTKPDAFLGLDIGGTGAKAGVFDRQGQMLGLGRVSYKPQQHPDGRVEIPIKTIEDAARNAAKTALASANANIRAIAVASQGQTFVSLDKNGNPLHPAIIWYDSRATQQAERFNAACLAAAGNGPPHKAAAIATVSKILWLREHHPETMAKAALHLLLPDFLAYRLTGMPAIDPNTAESTGLYSSELEDYSEAALQAAGLERTSLATVMPSGAVVGKLLPSAAADWGLPQDAVFVTGTNDQYAGALGAGNCSPGVMTETSGTCLALVTLVDTPPSSLPHGLFSGRFPIKPLRFILAYSKTAGVVLDWLRERFADSIPASEMDALAQTSPLGCNGLTMLPHFDGTVSPVPNANARGAFAGITLAHNMADFYRAALESLAFSLYECIRHVAATGVSAKTLRSIGGGARSDFWMQMKADVTGIAVEKPLVTEAASLGAAMLAAYGVRAFASPAEASRALYSCAKVMEPDAARHKAYAEPFARYQKLMTLLYKQP